MNLRTLHFMEMLRKGLESDVRFARLYALDEEMKSHPEIKDLSDKMKRIAEDFAEVRSILGPSAPDTKLLQRELSASKIALSSYPLVVEYDEAYRTCTVLYMEINDLLFGSFNKRVMLGANHD